VSDKMNCTYYELQIFRKSESQNCEHAFEWVVGVVDSVRIMISCDFNMNDGYHRRSKEVGSIQIMPIFQIRDGFEERGGQ
jgi:hypothetical protein